MKSIVLWMLYALTAVKLMDTWILFYHIDINELHHHMILYWHYYMVFIHSSYYQCNQFFISFFFRRSSVEHYEVIRVDRGYKIKVENQVSIQRRDYFMSCLFKSS